MAHRLIKVTIPPFSAAYFYHKTQNNKSGQRVQAKTPNSQFDYEKYKISPKNLQVSENMIFWIRNFDFFICSFPFRKIG